MQDIISSWTLPWRWWINASPQFGFININKMESSDPTLEQDVIQEVAGYGKQLGRIVEALSVVVSGMQSSSLMPSEQKALKDFLVLARQIATLKEKKGAYSPVPRITDIEQLLIDIRYLKKNNPEMLKRIIDELRDEKTSE